MKAAVFSLVLFLVGSLMSLAQTKGKNFFSLSAPSIDGKPVEFSNYSGKVVLAVNVASRCGYTPQYAGLEKLYQKYRDRGFVILGFPSNDFGSQEPGNNAEIKTFCKLNYDVQFPIFAKAHVTGQEKSPVYQFLIDSQNVEPSGEVQWNFEKFLIDRKGKLAKRFRSQVTPEDPGLVSALEAEIGKP